MWYHPLDTLVYNGITDYQADLGWCQSRRDHLMHFYYQHRGRHPMSLEDDPIDDVIELGYRRGCEDYEQSQAKDVART